MPERNHAQTQDRRNQGNGNQGGQGGSMHMQQDVMQAGNEFFEYVHKYIKEQPESAALWCFGIGFVLGWKLKPW